MKKRLMSLIIILNSVLLTSCNNDFGVWVRGMSNEETIKTSLNTEVIPYEKMFYIDYYITQSVTDQNIIKNILSRNLNRVYKLIDSANNYLDDSSNLINNVKVINESVNSASEVVVDEELFHLLTIAKTSSILNKSYSLFSSKLDQWWKEQFIKYNENHTNINLDPFYNSTSFSELADIVTCIPHTDADIESMLELNSVTKGVKYKVKESCLDDKVFPSINLYDLSMIYLADLVKTELLASSFNQGLIYVDGKLVTTLGSSLDKWSFAMRDPNSDKYEELKTIATAILKAEFTAYTIDDFPINENYNFIDDVNQKVIYRHEHINALTGYPQNLLRSIIGFSYSLSTLDLYFNTNQLFNQTSESLIKDNIINNMEIMYVTQEGIDDISKCENTTWCPITPASLYLKTTSNLNKLLQIKSGINSQIINE
jgi:hypothetical protein